MNALLDVRTAATRLSISPFTLRAWVRSGRVPHVRLGRLIMFEPQDLNQWIASRTHAAVAPSQEDGPIR